MAQLSLDFRPEVQNIQLGDDSETFFSRDQGEEKEEEEEEKEEEEKEEVEEEEGEDEVVKKESVVSGQAPGFAPVLSEDGDAGEEAKAGPGSSKGDSSVWACIQAEEMEWMPRKRAHFLKWQQQKMRMEKEEEEEEEKESPATKLKKKKKNRISKCLPPVEEEGEEEEQEVGEVEVVKKEVLGQASGFTQREVLSEDDCTGEEAKASSGQGSVRVSSAPSWILLVDSRTARI